MLDMAKGDAVWRNEMTEGERRELDLASRTRDVANENYRAVFARLKNRCIQRVRQKAKKNAD